MLSADVGATAPPQRKLNVVLSRESGGRVGLENLVGVAIGGVIGFLSGIGVESLRRLWDQQDGRTRRNRLLQLLFEEVEQLAELLDVDLGAVALDGAGSDTDQEGHRGQVRATIARLQENRTIYESQAERFLELPGYLPNALVRFYTRLQISCVRMMGALDDGDFPRLRDLRNMSLQEAEALKLDLREAMHK